MKPLWSTQCQSLDTEQKAGNLRHLKPLLALFIPQNRCSRKPFSFTRHKSTMLLRAFGIHLWTLSPRKIIVFSDENIFHHEGPIEFQQYWRGLSANPKVFSKRLQKTRSVMVCAALYILQRQNWSGRYWRTINSDYCVNISQKALLSIVDELYGCDYTFKEIDVAVHRSLYTTNVSIEMWNPRFVEHLHIHPTLIITVSSTISIPSWTM